MKDGTQLRREPDMKTATATTSVTLQHARAVATAVPSSTSADFLSAAETQALLHSSLTFRQQRLLAPEMLSTDDAAALVGTSRVTINAWVAKGRAIGLTQTKRGLKLPAWQFEPRFWDVLPALSRALGTTDGWALLAYVESPLGALDGRTPRQAIEQGQAERVLALAAHEEP